MKLHHLPNIISIIRILCLIPLSIAIISQREMVFISILFIMFLSDALDGFIARRFNCSTALGAKLDSAADILMTIAAISGVVIMKWDNLESHYLIYIFGTLYFLAQFVSLLKFKSFPSLHLYSFKLTLLIQGAFVLVLFTIGFSHLFFVLALLLGIIACLEEILLLFMMQHLKPNVRGLFWFMKNIHN